MSFQIRFTNPESDLRLRDLLVQELHHSLLTPPSSLPPGLPDPVERYTAVSTSPQVHSASSTNSPGTPATCTEKSISRRVACATS